MPITFATSSFRRRAVAWIASGLLIAGCADSPSGSGPGATAGVEQGTGGAPAEEEQAPDPRPVAVEQGSVRLSPDLMRIMFVAKQVSRRDPRFGARPDPRTGGFARFTGKVEVDADARTLKSVSIEIETASVWTPIPELTNHLKSVDFFDVKELPKATFVSKSIAVNGPDTKITGDLTLHGVTREINFPATVTITPEGMTLVSRFTIDRAQFDMNYGEGQIEKLVAVTVVIGEKTEMKTGSGS